MTLTIIFLTAVCFGSFANNLISFYSGSSLFDLLKSSCLCGNKKLKFFELIPLLSFIIQKRKCRSCERKIPYRYLIVELITGLTGIIFYIKFDFSPSLFIYFSLYLVLLIIAVTDLFCYRIPNRLILVVLLITGIKFSIYQTGLLTNLITAFSITSLFLIINKCYLKLSNKLAIGYGDIKLIAALTLFLNFPLSIIGLWFSSLIAIPGFYLLKRIYKNNIRDKKIPFGFFLGIGYTGTLLLGSRILIWYEHYFNYMSKLF